MIDPPPSSAVLFAGQQPPWALPSARLMRGGAAAPETLDRCDVAFIDATSIDFVTAARHMRASAPALQLVVVAPTAHRDRIERALIFAPGIGEVWIEPPEAVGDELVQRAAEVTRQRRRYRATRAQLEEAFSALTPSAPRTPYISDAYLAALLQVLPDPILSIDEASHVLSWSPAAEQWLELRRGRASSTLTELLRPLDGPQFADILDRGRRQTVRAVVEWRRSDGTLGIAEITVTPLRVGSHAVRAVVLHDLTEQRLAQQQLEEQAAELEAQTEQLAAQRDELARLARARSRFYASMSHEIRTPINAILGYNDLLLAGIYGPTSPQQSLGLERVQAAARHLRELVNDVLDLSKIESGKIEIVVADGVDVGELIREVVDTIGPAAAEQNSDVQCAVPPGLTVSTDPRRVRQILLNLLSNAIKFGDGLPVRVRAGTAEDGRVFIEVRDQGRGIAGDHLERVFEEFVQLDSLVQGGTGLGLAISKRLAEALGGELHAVSQVGAGSAFTLLLPAVDPEPHQ